MPKKNRRSTLVVDAAMQYSVIFVVVSILLVTAFFCVAAVYVLPDNEAVGLTGKDAVRLAIRVNLIYCGFCLASLSWIALVMTHRVAGPAMVIERAIRGFKDGVLKPRLTLRRHDYLTALGRATEEHAEFLRRQSELRAEIASGLREALENDDDDAIRALADQIERMTGGATADDAVVEPARPAVVHAS